jgi:uncharacterized protein (DUF1330 family)
MPKTNWSLSRESNKHADMTNSLKYYQLVFIWMKDPKTFGRYLELARPVVERYGGALERMINPQSIYAEKLGKPDVVNIVYYNDKAAYHGMNNDPDFKKVVPLRSQSIDMITIEGPSLGGTLTHERLADRLYLVEVARFGSRGADGYRAYETESNPVMEKYGYHVERTMGVDSASGFAFKPDVVKVAYFDRRDGMDRLQQDAGHHRIERELYPMAVPESVWVIGEVHPMTLGQSPS